MGRTPCCDKEKVKRGTWSPDEDAKLKSYIEIHGTVENWISLPKKAGIFFFLFSHCCILFFGFPFSRDIYLLVNQ